MKNRARLPRFNRTFSYMSTAIDYLKVRQPPIAEQFRPSFVAMVAPDSKQRDPVIYFRMAAAPPLDAAAQFDSLIRRSLTMRAGRWRDQQKGAGCLFGCQISSGAGDTGRSSSRISKLASLRL
jgi:hypothetical protein